MYCSLIQETLGLCVSTIFLVSSWFQFQWVLTMDTHCDAKLMRHSHEQQKSRQDPHLHMHILITLFILIPRFLFSFLQWNVQ